MTCKIDHADPECIPEFLCRACHPEMVTTAADIAKAEAHDHEQRRQEQDAERATRALRKAKARLRQLTNKGEPEDGTVNATIAASMRRKIEQLEQRP
jgi:hypothetical protein